MSVGQDLLVRMLIAAALAMILESFAVLIARWNRRRLAMRNTQGYDRRYVEQLANPSFQQRAWRLFLSIAAFQLFFVIIPFVLDRFV